MDPVKIIARGHAVVSVPEEVDVRALRRRMRMTQNTFSARFGFSVAALRHWERGERRPSGAALTLLNVISRQPRAVLLALRAPIPRHLGDRRRGED
jgi:putative transcriptional regulator